MDRFSTMSIGTVPCEENCAQTGSKSYDWGPLQQLECRAYIAALRRKFGPEPDGARFRVKANPHDFGTYREVEIRFNEHDEAAAEYAYKAEAGLNLWEEVGMWAPVKYDDRGDPIHVITDERAWIRERNPLALPELPDDAPPAP